MFIAIVPAYNEAHRISSVVLSLLHHVDEVVVVDDGSTDMTAEQAGAAGATVLCHEINRGQGAALETGQQFARDRGASYVLHFDGDGQFSVSDIAPAWQYLKEKQADILFGSRFLDQRSEIPFIKKRILLPVAKLINRLYSRMPLTDAHNGFRIFSKKALQQIRLSQDRMAHATEIIMLVRRHNLCYVEFPVKVTYYEYGQGVEGGMRVLRDLLVGKFLK